ncbi:probable ATP-dependent DNA helicase HFM1 [Hyla sarda]|uniref:probable ATP-dependent DNA helicase HFM1 n=1 Tax=Hyla sarda TaxID=327740 RepID=UPI0024C3958F|nr:probable ATP-dependent DNA helicase HFM1 [Hyla sarda]XP_056379144.1 probable ATP-dependent DNA helicase HFM1 [Hyla sarda]
MEEFDLCLEDLFYTGPSQKNVLDKEGLKDWLYASAPCIDDIPKSQDLQKEIGGSQQSAMIRRLKTFIPPLKKTKALDANNPAMYSSWHDISCSMTGTPNTQNTCTQDMIISPPYFPLGDNDKQRNDFQFYEQNLPQTQKVNGNPSMFRQSLFRQHDSFTFGDSQVPTDDTVLDLTCGPNENTDTRPSCNEDQGRFSFPSSLKLFNGEASTPYGILKPVSEIPTQFRDIFKEFPYFNYIQSKAFDDVLYSDKNFVMCSPTGSGKTVIFEIAIVRLLMETPAPWTNVKIVYMAPIKALCGQRFEDWKEKFEPVGIVCKELTGDTEVEDLFEIQHAHIIMTTPEKWDSMTRKWRDNSLVQLVRLFLIDEVHTVKDESRGATLEVVVSRMKTMQAKNSEEILPMRFVAVSATIPNAGDIAEWLSDGKYPAICMKMDESHRPVKLRKVVLGFPSGCNQTEYKFDLSLNYKIAGVIQTYSDQKPTLVFCATRKGVQQAASVLAKEANFTLSIEHKQRLLKAANAIKDAKLRDLVLYGVGYHHAGVDVSDRKIIEATFTAGELPVLFTTSTLAMGVNLPAHLVIIKSTMHYAAGMFQEYSETDILQMIGRAGRPQFDTTATAVIMTRFNTKEKYVQMVNGADTIESSLHRHLVEHLNAEIALHTVTDVNIALEWIRSTFLYIRALKNPAHYGFPQGLDKEGIEAKLQELCLRNLNDLSSVGLIRMDEEFNFKPTGKGKLMASYYIAFDTAKLLNTIQGQETMADLVILLSTCKEFSDVQLRTSEKRVLNSLNKDKNRVTIRFPMEGKIKSREMKVNCLIQAQLGCLPVQDFSLTQDMAKIFRQGIRVAKCLSEFLALQENKFTAFLNATILTKCFRCKLWENSLHVSKQLDKIGVTLANAMVNAGLTSFKKIEDFNARELELIVNRHPPFGNQIKESVMYLPKYRLSFEQVGRYNPTTAEVLVTVKLINFEQLQKKRTAPDSHHVSLVIGDSDNQVVFKQKIMDSVMLKSGIWMRKIEVKKASTSEILSINLISSEYVGLDIQQNISVLYALPQRIFTDTKFMGKYEEKFSDESNERPNSGSLQTFSRTGIRECNHHCKNKEACGHECCKTGVSYKADGKTNSDFSSYLSDLRSRNSVSSAPPVKRLKMQMLSGLKNVNLEKFVFIPQTSMTEFSRSTTAPVQAVLEKQDISETRNYTQQPQDGARCSYFGNREYVKQQSASTSQYHNNMTDADKYSSWSQKPGDTIIDLDDDVWDDFDDENLVDASSITMEKSIPGLNITTYNKNQSKVTALEGKQDTVVNYIHQQLEYSNLKTNLNINIQKQVDFPDSQISKYRPNVHKPVAATVEQYSGRPEVSALNSPLSYKAQYSGDFFVSVGHERYSNLKTNLNINIQKQVDFPDSQIEKYRPNVHKPVAATVGQYSGRPEVSALNSPLSYKAQYSGDFFVSVGHESENQDEKTQAFIGIFDGIF